MAFFSLCAWLQIPLLQERHSETEAAQDPTHGAQFKRVFCYVGPHLHAPMLVSNGYFKWIFQNPKEKKKKKRETAGQVAIAPWGSR